jgi:hypothetical protein
VLVAAVVCPHPPLLVPGVDPGEGADGGDLRSACLAAMSVLVGATPDLLVVVGSAPQAGLFPQGASGSLAQFGVNLRIGDESRPPSLPLSLTIGRWLVDQTAPEVPHLFLGIAADEEAVRCAALGAELAERADRVALLVMGDGSARRSLKGPGSLDERAARFDAEVQRALDGADHAALLGLDSGLADDLLVAGRAPWQVLAGAARGATGAWRGEVTYASAPFGVSYLVATWSGS